jgi:hypothetical protein
MKLVHFAVSRFPGVDVSLFFFCLLRTFSIHQPANTIPNEHKKENRKTPTPGTKVTTNVLISSTCKWLKLDFNSQL